MKRLLVYLTGALVLCGCWQATLAQTVIKTDGSCTYVTGAGCNGPSGQGCDSTTFTVPTGETAYFNVYLQGCTKTTACDCYAAGYIYDNRNNRMACLHTACDSCSIPPVTQVNLTAGQTYKLYACKVGCEEGCTGCSSVCVAYSVVSYFP
jgi:hypothetical protein